MAILPTFEGRATNVVPGDAKAVAARAMRGSHTGVLGELQGKALKRFAGLGGTEVPEPLIDRPVKAKPKKTKKANDKDKVYVPEGQNGAGTIAPDLAQALNSGPDTGKGVVV